MMHFLWERNQMISSRHTSISILHPVLDLRFSHIHSCWSLLMTPFAESTSTLFYVAKVLQFSYCKASRAIVFNLLLSLSDTYQERKWRVGRVGNCPPSFWQNSNAAAVVAAIASACIWLTFDAKVMAPNFSAKLKSTTYVLHSREF